MDRNEIIRIAREADIKFKTDVFRSDFCDGVYKVDLERFAALIAAAEREAVETEYPVKFASVKAFEDWCASIRANEREACAKVCESLFDMDDDSCNEAEQCAAAIRARGQA